MLSQLCVKTVRRTANAVSFSPVLRSLATVAENTIKITFVDREVYSCVIFQLCSLSS